MYRLFKNVSYKKQVDIFIVLLIFLIIFKLIFPASQNYFYYLFNEILVLSEIVIGIIVSKKIISRKKNEPLHLILNTGVIVAGIFLFSSISLNLLDNVKNDLNKIPLYESFSSVIIVIVNLLGGLLFSAALIYLFGIYHELFLLRQKKDLSFYFNSMSIFFALAFLTQFLKVKNEELEFIPVTFFVMSVILIVINSFRVAWIAFITKKQKLYVLLISTILIVLFAINLGMVEDDGFTKNFLMNFSPGVHLFLSLLMLYGLIYYAVLFITTLFHLPTAEAIDKKVEEVSSLIDLSKLMTRVLDIKDLSDSITNYIIKVTNSDAAWFVELKSEKIEIHSTANISNEQAEIITKFCLKNNVINIDRITVIDKSSNNLLLTEKSFEKYFAIISSPLLRHNVNNGFIIALRTKAIQFDDEEIKSFQAFAQYATIAFENAKLIEESIEKERLESELKVARDIQYKILPREIPNYKNLDISSLFVPAFEVGGDYYDFFYLNDCKLAFVIADVSGKGISAAFIMAEVKGIFESLSNVFSQPKELLIAVNSILKKSLDRKNFVTAIYGIFDCSNSKLTISRAGHVPMYLCRDKKITKIIPNGIGLGIEKTDIFESHIKEIDIELHNGDIITLFTDGVSEAKNKNMEEFGYNRLENLICENSDLSVDDLSKKIMEEVSVFSKDYQQHDDITLILFKWKNNLTAEVK